MFFLSNHQSNFALVPQQENTMSIDVFASQTVTNSRGNSVLINEAAVADLGFMVGCSDSFKRRLTAKGWQVYETLHDGSQFGVFVDVAGMQMLTYSDGEVQLVKCREESSFQAELALMAEFYGEPNLDFSALNPHASETAYVLPAIAERAGLASTHH